MDYKKLADFLFPEVTETPNDLEGRYPPRDLPEGARVTRMAPSPTGFMHLGNLYGAIADERLAHQSGGVFYLRIEDTDQKREVEGGVDTILSAFSQYKLPFDEGATSDGETGNYGPYRQRQRAELYHICAKWLMEQGRAYPCFLTEDALAAIREKQVQAKLNFGCYGPFAKYRDSKLEEIEQRVNAGEPYVIRYRSEGSPEGRIKVGDIIRGALELAENNQDVVLLKQDGIPTYHFAHVVDDHFMRTNLVVRGEEWLATLPIHVQLFAAMGWKPPKYLHTAHLMKSEGGSKRKLSKRKDPELALGFYGEKGYSVRAVKEYLMTLLNSNFEEWRHAAPFRPLEDFPFSVKKMGTSGALFDINKLDDVSKDIISRLTPQQALDELLVWAQKFDPAFHRLLADKEDYARSILTIGRGGSKPRKDIIRWSEAKEYMSFFYDELFAPDYTLPENISPGLARRILEDYITLYDPADDADIWFAQIKKLADVLGFASNMKDYKKNPGNYPGSVADISMVLRLAITGRAQSPDLFEVMRLMGKPTIQGRLRRMADFI